MAVRLDSGRMDAPRKTPQGGLRASAFVTRAGIFVYHKADGSEVREWRPPIEVFRHDSLASLAGAPVTHLHPPVMVRANNFKKWSVGHVADDVRVDGNNIATELFVQDEQAVKDIESKKTREISCGYTCDIDDTSGVTPEGERYDRIQKNINYNHVALVPKGRAGAEIGLRLDADDNEIAPDYGDEETPSIKNDQEPVMKIERLDGVEYEIASPQHKAALEFKKEISAREDEVKAGKSELDKLQGRADAADARIKELEGQLVEAKDPAKLDAAVTARSVLVTSARKILGSEVKLDGKSEREVMVEALAKSDAELKTEDKSDDYVRAAFDFATRSARKDAHAAVRIAATVPAEAPTEKRDARQEMIKRQEDAWKQPLAASK